jgi:hypothetical protein
MFFRSYTWKNGNDKEKFLQGPPYLSRFHCLRHPKRPDPGPYSSPTHGTHFCFEAKTFHKYLIKSDIVLFGGFWKHHRQPIRPAVIRMHRWTGRQPVPRIISPCVPISPKMGGKIPKALQADF